MNFYLIRHGRQNSTDCNVNVPLSKEGRRQAELLAGRMEHYPVDILYTSHLIRAVETAQIAFGKNKKLLDNIQVREGLAEIDFGSLTGKEDRYVKDFYRDYYEKQLKLFQNPENRQRGTALDKVNSYVGEFFVPPQDMWYPQGENSALVLARVMPVVREWIAGDWENIAVVCHGGVIRILLCALFGGDFGRRLQFGTSLENCSITKIHFDREKHAFFLDRFNDYAHIEAEPSLLREKFVTPH